MTRYKWLFVSLVLVTFSLHAQEPFPGFEEYARQAMKDWEVPGFAIAVVKDDKVIYAKGFGVRKLGESAPVDEKTIFAVASTTKAMTAACLGMLVDEKKISWDDPAIKYLKDFQLYDPYVTRELTVRDLLTHRSGLERGDLLWYSSPYNREEVLTRIRFLKPAWSFRSRYGYQNIMYLAAGQVIQSVTGKPWEEFIKERLFSPLGMVSSSASQSALRGVENVATPHASIDKKLQPRDWVDIDNIGPAGSVNSNVLDMAQWIRLNLSKGVYEGKRVLSEEVVKEMQTPQTLQRLDSLTQVWRPSTHFVAYGLGWGLSDYLGNIVVQHSGAIHGMRARVVLLPEIQIGFVILMNSPRELFHAALAYRIIDHYLGAEPRDWSTDYLKFQKEQTDKADAEEKKRNDERVKGTKPSMSLDQYTGVYENEMYGELKVVLEKGKLVIQFYPTFVGDATHWHFDTFQIAWRDRTLGKEFMTFILNSRGKVDLLKWDEVAEFKKK
ncbi:MAG TPA: serine hydrolase [Bacteroidota bacterium]|nr:serine hydrolase [Bacteroidota bacterium]